MGRLLLVGEDEPESVDHAGEAAQEGEEDVEPEMKAQAYLQECGNGRKNDGKDEFDYDHGGYQGWLGC